MSLAGFHGHHRRLQKLLRLEEFLFLPTLVAGVNDSLREARQQLLCLTVSLLPDQLVDVTRDFVVRDCSGDHEYELLFARIDSNMLLK